MVSFSELGEDFDEPMDRLYSFIAGMDYEVSDDDFPKICQCCVPIMNDGRLEINEIFHLILERTPGLDPRIEFNSSYETGMVIITDINDGMYGSLYIHSCQYVGSYLKSSV